MRHVMLIMMLSCGCAGRSLDTAQGTTSSPVSGDGAPPPQSDGGITVAGVPPVGIYAVDVAPATGNCQPPNLSGPLQHPLQLSAGVDEKGSFFLAWPELDSFGRLIAAVGVDLGKGRWQNAFDTCGTRHGLLVDELAQSSTTIDVRVTDTWSDHAS